MEIILFIPKERSCVIPYVNGERLYGIREICNVAAHEYKYGVYERVDDEDGHRLKITIPAERVKIHDGILDILDEAKEPDSINFDCLMRKRDGRKRD